MTAATGTAIAIHSAIADDNTQWIHVMPPGRFDGRDGRGPYELTDAAAVLDATRRYHGKKQMVVDFEHQSVHSARNGKPAPAAGWVSGMKAEVDGLWALVTWTAQAAEAIRAKSYRYLSPVFGHDKAGRVTRFLSIGLTNTPNLELTALARSQELSMDNEMTEVRALLGLATDASSAEVAAAINALQGSAHSANPDPAKFVPIGDFERVVADANKLRQGVTETAAVAHVDTCIRLGKLAPFMKDWAVSLCTTNMPAFDSFIDRTGPAFVAMSTMSQVGGVTVPGSGKQSALTVEEKAVCSTMGLTEEEFIKGRKAD